MPRNTAAAAVLLGCCALAPPLQAQGPGPATVACDALEPRARDGQRPDEALLRQRIACLWQQPARAGMGGAVTVEVTRLALGKPRRWGEPSDFGRAYLSTRVWPVTARYVRRTHGVGGLTVAEGESAFNCFVDVDRRWQCTPAEPLVAEAVRFMPPD